MAVSAADEALCHTVININRSYHGVPTVQTKEHWQHVDKLQVCSFRCTFEEIVVIINHAF